MRVQLPIHHHLLLILWLFITLPFKCLLPLSLAASCLTQIGVEVIQSLCSALLCRPPNSANIDISTLSSKDVLDQCRKIWTYLCILSIISAQKQAYSTNAF